MHTSRHLVKALHALSIILLLFPTVTSSTQAAYVPGEEPRAQHSPAISAPLEAVASAKPIPVLADTRADASHLSYTSMANSTGADGPLVVTGTVYADVVRTPSTANTPASSTTIVVSDTAGLAAGDEVLIMDMLGADAGVYETAVVAAVGSGALTLATPLLHGYDGTLDKVMVQRVPNYAGVRVDNGGNLTAHAWDGQTGGVVFFRALTVTVEAGGTIDASGLGYRGGAIAPNSSTSPSPGEGPGGGQAGGNSGYDATGGGGGSYGFSGYRGHTGSSYTGGWNVGGALPGSLYGETTLSRLYPGSGGGGGGRNTNNGKPGKAGQAGGGIVFIDADFVQVGGGILANGRAAVAKSNCQNWDEGSGGAGSGGSIHIASPSIVITGSVNALGGSGNTNPSSPCWYGGQGGKGRIRLDYSFLDGTTNPAPGDTQPWVGSSWNFGSDLQGWIPQSGSESWYAGTTHSADGSGSAHIYLAGGGIGALSYPITLPLAPGAALGLWYAADNAAGNAITVSVDSPIGSSVVFTNAPVSTSWTETGQISMAAFVGYPATITLSYADDVTGTAWFDDIVLYTGPADADLSSLEMTPGTMSADGAQTATVTATLRNVAGEIMANQDVELYVFGKHNRIDGQPVGDTAWTPVGKTDATGVVTATLASTRAETKRVIIRSNALVLSLSAQVTFTPMAPVQLLVLLPGEVPNPGASPGYTGSPAAAVAGVPFTFTVSAVDVYWNPVPTVTHSVLLTGTDPMAEMPSPVELQGGTALVAATFKTAGSYTIEATDFDDPAIAGDTSAVFVVQSSPAFSLALAISSTQWMSIPADVTVTAYDIYGNVAVDYTGTVRFASSDGQATLPVTYTFTTGTGGDNGTHTFADGITFRTAGPQWARVEDLEDPNLVVTATIEASNDVVIDEDATWAVDAVVVDTLVVTNSATLTLVGAATITATTITVAAGAAISADGRGYAGQQGLGAGGHSYDAGAGGGGYGGAGGNGQGAAGGSAYGSVYQPADLGSGGGYCYSDSGAAGKGGGAIRLVVHDTLRVDGRLSANGTSGAAADRGHGGGSGGSLWIEAPIIAGTGVIQANGGNGSGNSRPAGGGAGGRIAIYAVTRSPNVTVEAHGGYGYQYGGPGTVYLKGAAGLGTLIVENAGHNGRSAVLTAGQYEFDAIELSRYGHLTVISSTSVLTLTNDTLVGDSTAQLAVEGVTAAPSSFIVSGTVIIVQGELAGPEVLTTRGSGGLELYAHTPWRSGVYTFTEVTVGTSTTLRLVPYIDGDGVYTDDYGVELRVQDLTIDEGGTLLADGLGYAGQQGPGAGGHSYDTGAGGGGYGGAGGNGQGAAGGGAYGSVYQPVELGSGGGYCYSTSEGAGRGGGAIHLVVADTLHVDGQLSVNGTNGASADRGHGGGSGGSLWIEAPVIAGTGTIQANGGNGSGGGYRAGGGAGGRIAIDAGTDAFSGAIQAEGGSGYEPGGAGTIYLSGVDPFTSTVVAAPNAGVVANGVAFSTITVTLMNTAGEPIPAKDVYLQIAPATGSLLNGVPITSSARLFIGPSGTDGVMTATLASTKAQVKTLTAWAESVRLLNVATVTFTASAPDAVQSVLYASPTRVAANGVATATIYVRVYDAFRNPVPGATVVLSSTGAASVETQPAATNANGQTWGAVRDNVPEVVTVTATADGISITNTVQIGFEGADLDVTKSGPAEVGLGQLITYNLGVRNDGLMTALGTLLTDTLPVSVSYFGHTAPVEPLVNDRDVVWALGDLAKGESRAFAVIGQIASDLAPGLKLANQAKASSNSPEENLPDNTAVFTTGLKGADLAVSKSSEGLMTTGYPLTYTLRVHNHGQLPAASVIMTDTLPQHLTYVTQTSPYSFTRQDQALVWQLGTLGVGESAQFQVRVMAAWAAGGSQVTNRVEATTETPEDVLGDNVAVRTNAIVFPTPKLAVSPAFPTLSVPQGGQATLTVTVRNDGTAVLSDTTIVPPPNIAWATISDDDLGNLAPGASASFVVRAAAAAALPAGYYRDRIRVNSTNGGSTAIALTIQVMGPSRDLALHVVNNGGVPVPNALVTLEETVAVETEGSTSSASFYHQAATDAAGMVMMSDLAVGDFAYSITAPGHRPASGIFYLEEGAGPQDVTVEMIADLALTASPASPQIYVVRGESALVDVVVRNTSAVSLTNVEIAPPDALPWVYLGQAGQTALLAPGQAFTLTINAAPPQELETAVYSDTVGVSADGGLQAALPFSVRVTDAAARTLRVTIVDPEGDPVAGAELQLVSQQSTLAVQGTVTRTTRESHYAQADGLGQITFPNISLGRYSYYVAINGYQVKEGILTVSPGVGVQEETLVVPPPALSVSWSVEKTAIEDVYTATLQMTFDPYSPAPTMMFAPPSACFKPQEVLEVRNAYPVTIENAIIKIDFSCPVDYNPIIGDIGPNSVAAVPVTFGSECCQDNPPCGQAPKREAGSVKILGKYNHWLHSITYDVGMSYTPPMAPGFFYTMPMKLVNEGFPTGSNLYGDTTVEEVKLSQPPVLDWIVVTPTTFYDVGPGEEVDFMLEVHVPEWLQEGKYSDVALIETSDGVKTGLEIWAEMTGDGLRIETQFATPLAPGEEPPPGGDPHQAAGWDPPYWWNTVLSQTYPAESEPITMTWGMERTCCRECPHDPVYAWGWVGGGFVGTVTGGYVPPYTPHFKRGLVYLEINQRVSLEREAFIARMVLDNAGGLPIDDISVDILVTDEYGFPYVVDPESGEGGFYVLPATPTDLGDLPPGQTEAARWLLVPDKLGITEPEGRFFDVEATLTYVVNGETFTLYTQKERINVMPQPQVMLDYILPWYVWENEPFRLWVMATNFGYGTAKNLRIVSAQPRIVDNQSGLPIDFRITSPLEVQFGNMEPGQTDVRYWEIVANHDGAFVEFKASCEHYNYLGLPLSDLVYCNATTIYNPPTDEAGNWSQESACMVSQRQGHKADPVNTYSGNFTYNETDVSIPTWGDPLMLERSYNSRDRADGPFGPGWTHNYDTRLSYQSFLPISGGMPAGAPINIMEFKAPRGSRLYYAVESDGTFTPFPGVKADLERVSGTYTVTLPNQRAYVFNAAQRLAEQRDANGNALALYYDGDNLARVEDEAGRALSFTYNGDGHITSMTDPLGRVTYYGYDEHGYLARVMDGAGGVVTMTYVSGSGGVRMLASMVDANGHAIVRNQYDGRGRVSRQMDAAGQLTTFEYDVSSSGGSTTVTDPLGNVTRDYYNAEGALVKREDAYGDYEEYEYDGDFNQIAVTDKSGRRSVQEWNECGCNPTADIDPLGHRTSYTYDEIQRLTSVTDPLNRTTSYAYGPYANPVAVTDALGQVTVATYGPHGELLVGTDPAGRTITYGYDIYGNRTAITDPLGHTTTTAYDLAGRPVRTTDALGRETFYAYDANDKLLRTTNPLSGTSVNTYDAAGNRLTETDANGHTTRFEYDERNDVRKTTDALGGVTWYTYDAVGNLQSTTGPLSRTTSYEYDQLYRPVTITDPLSGTTVYAYNLAGSRVRETDANGHTTTYTYDALERLTSALDHLGHRTSFGYDAVGNQTVITDALGRETRTAYDALNRPVRITKNYVDGAFDASRPDEDLRTTTVYDVAGNVARVTNPKSQITRFGYDAGGSLITTTNALGDRELRAYDAVGNLVSLTDPKSNVTRFEYDALNRPVTTTDPLGGTTANTYDAEGNLIAVTDPRSYLTRLEYDALDRLLTTTNALSGAVVNTYDAVGNLVAITDAAGRTTPYEYDALDRLVSATDPMGHTTRHAYDAVGNETAVVDANGHATLSIYDELNRLTRVVDAAGNTTRYIYDAVGNQILEIDAEGRTALFEYDGVNRLVTATDALGGQTFHAYDAAGNEVAVTDAEGRTTRYEYDALNRPVATTNALGEAEAYAYDAAGNLVQVADYASRVTRYDYDALGRLVTTTNALGEAGVRAYDEAGNLIAVTDTAGHTTAYAYDALNRAVTTTNALSGTTVNTYDAVGNLVGETDAAGRATAYAYDGANRLVTITDALSGTTVFTYDAAGNQLGLTDAGGRTTSHEYDALNRPVAVINPLGGKTQYGYDRVGNQVWEVDAEGRRTSFAYDALNRAITITDALGGTTMSAYDAVGNPLSLTDPRGSTTTYAYDALDRLVTTTNALGDREIRAYDTAGNLAAMTDAEGRTTRYAYDALDRLAVTTNALGGTTVTAYDAAGLLAQVVDPKSQVTRYAYDALDRLITTTNALSGTAVNAYDAVGNLVQVTDYASRVTRYAYDALDRAITTTNPLSGTTVTTYDAVGNLVAVTDPEGRTTRFGYDALDRAITTTNAISGTAVTTYDAVGNPVQIMDYASRITRYGYDGLDRLTVLTDALGHATQYGYDAVGNQTVLTDALGNVTTSAYDALNRLSAITDAQGGQTRFTYDRVGNRTALTDAEGRATHYAYDALNRAVTTTNALGDTGVRAYDAVGNLVQVTDPRSHTTRYEYDVLGRLVRVVDALSGTLTNVYDAAGNLVQVTDPRSNVTRYEHDALDRLVTTTNPLSGTAVNVYDAVGNLVQFTDYASHVTTYAYDALDRAVTTTNALSGTTITAYDAVGNPVSFTDPKSQVTHYEYDALDQLVAVVDPLDRATRYAYDAVGNRTSLTDAAGSVSTFAYDSLYRLSATTDPLGHATRYGYDRVGNQVVMTDANGVATGFEYDALNRLAAVVENYRPGQAADHQTNVRTAYDYDAAGNRTAVADANGHTTRSAYDALNRLVQLSDPLDHAYTLSYDAAGLLTRRVDANGAATRYEYDGLNRLVRIVYPEGTVDLAYDAVGNRTVMTDAVGVTRYEYDPVYRPTAVTDANGQRVAYEYDAANNRTALHYPDGKQARYAYDAADQLTNVTDWDGGVTAYAYDPAGRPLTQTLPNGVRTAYAYDAAGRLVGMNHARGAQVVARYEYTLDAAGNRVRAVEALAEPGVLLAADFAATPLSGAAPLTVTFTDFSTGAIADHLWAFGDGLTSTLANPVHTYWTAGIYTVSLTVSGPGGTDVETKLGYVEVQASAGSPTAGFAGVPLSGTAPLTVTFTDSSTGEIANRLWAFGDGYTSTLANPVHTYWAAGVYTVSLTVSGPVGTDVETKPGYVEVQPSDDCPVAEALESDTQGIQTYQGLRDEVFAPSVPGRRYNALYAQYATEVSFILLTHLDLMTQGRAILTKWQPSVQELLTTTELLKTTGLLKTTEQTPNGPSLSAAVALTVTAEDVAEAQVWLASLAEHGSIGLGAEIESFSALMDSFVDLTPAQVWEMLNAEQQVHAIYLPLVLRNADSGDAGGEGTGGVNTTDSEDDATLPPPPSGSGGGTGSKAAQKGVTPASSRPRLLLSDPLILFMAPLLLLAALGRRRREKYLAWPLSVALLVVAVAAIGWSMATPVDVALAAPVEESRLPLTRPASTTDSRVITYTYDPLYRLAAANYSGGQRFEYRYDAAGNRLQMTTPVTTVLYAYDAANRLTSVNGTPYTWDDNGNLLSDGRRSMTYDSANRLVQVVSGTLTTAYTYAGDGVRLAQTVNGQTTRYVNDVAAPLPQVLQENLPTTQVAYLNGLEQVARYDASGWAYQHSDGLGSVRQLTNETGQVTLERTFAPFGELMSQVGTTQASFGYAGEQHDAASGLIFLRARYYDPATGRFLTRDPYPAYATQPSTLHRYAYVGNNPINRVDPSGLRAQARGQAWTPQRAVETAQRLSGGRHNAALAAGREAGAPDFFAAGRAAWGGRTWTPPRPSSPIHYRQQGQIGPGPRPHGKPYDMSKTMADRTKAFEQINKHTQDLSRGKLPKQQCGPTGIIGDFMNWLNSPEGGAIVLIAAAAIVIGAGAIAIATFGLGAVLASAGLGFALGAISGAAGQFVQDLSTGNWSDPREYFKEGGWEKFKEDLATVEWSSPEEYGKQMLAGGIAGAVAGVVGLGGAALGLSAPVIGGLAGFSSGAFQQTALNMMNGDPWYAGVGQQAFVGAIGGAVAGGITGMINPQSLPARMAVGGFTGGLVSGGTQIGMNLLTGRPWNEGLGAAVAVGMSSGLVDAFTDSFGDHLMEPILTRPRPGAGDVDTWRRPGDGVDWQGRETTDLSGPVVRGKPGLDEGQRLIDQVLQDKFQNVDLHHRPRYDPGMDPKYAGQALRGKDTLIGPEALRRGDAEIVKTIAHEEMHHRIDDPTTRRAEWLRKRGIDPEVWAERVAQRYGRMKIPSPIQDKIRQAKSYQENLGEAPGTKTIAASGEVKTISGWSDNPDAVQAVKETSAQIGHDLKPAGYLDQGEPGRYHASHAEKQVSVLAPNEPVGVSSPMCTDCQNYFSKLAQFTGQPQVVADPDVVRIFYPNGDIQQIK